MESLQVRDNAVSRVSIHSVGVGVSFTRDAASLMVGQYFKRRREQVEILLVGSFGMGIFILSELTLKSLR